MVKPQSLWALFKSCEDSQWLGDVCRSLGGQNVALDKGQRFMLQSLKLDNEWHNEAIEERQRTQRERQARYRERQAKDTQGATAKTPAPKSAANSSATLKKPAPAPVAIPRRTGETVNADLSKVDISDDGFFSGVCDSVLMARKVTGDMGKGAGVFWRNWIKADAEKGEGDFLQILFSFKREIQAGEDVENRGAAFTQRLKDWRKNNPVKAKAGQSGGKA